ncbi:MAG: HAMP domain-containing sensor histidine kinase [Dehalococcoidia bacterium]|nr:HAMP domain-containing sensor histidine kinase [Dehalococcoidia bacterium]
MSISVRNIIRDVSKEPSYRELRDVERRLQQELEAERQKRADFLRVLVHELKGSLTPLVFSSQLLLSELSESPVEDASLVRLAGNMQRGAQRLNKLIDELLDLARGELFMLKLHTAQLNMSELLLQISQEMSPIMAQQGKTLVLEVPPSLPPVTADEDRIRQIITNLFSNALKFTPPGGTITLEARAEPDKLIVAVRDTGSGMTEDEQRRLFEPYHRVEKDRERFNGLGACFVQGARRPSWGVALGGERGGKREHL